MSRRLALSALLLAVALGACSGGGGSDKGATSSTAAPTSIDVRVTAGPVAVEKTGAELANADAARDAILAAVQGYVQAATARPLLTGKAGDLAAVTTPAALVGLQGADAAAATDVGIGKAAGLDVTVAPVAITVLADGQGQPVLASATVTIDARGRTKAGRVTVHRTGELALVPGADGWRIDSYRLAVERTGAATASSTTTTGAPR